MHVRSLHLYPVKSTAAYDVAQARVEPWGLADDRRWLVVDAHGHKVNPLRHPRILGVRAEPTPTGIVLHAPHRSPLAVATPADAPRVRVNLSRQPALRYAGPEAAAWLSAAIGTEVRLVWQDDPFERGISTRHGGIDGDALSLADTAPILLTTTASLAQLQQWVDAGPEPTPLEMARFRPNVVVDGELAPFVEDRWSRVRVGEVTFRFTEHCDRCAITTIQPDTLTHGKEPVRTLATYRHWDGLTWFGIRMAPVGSGTLRVGDAVEVLETS